MVDAPSWFAPFAEALLLFPKSVGEGIVGGECALANRKFRPDSS
jgi:hypothetical protein